MKIILLIFLCSSLFAQESYIDFHNRTHDSFHYVQKGDSFNEILKTYGFNEKDQKHILFKNGINNPNHLRIGQKIYFPYSPGTRTKFELRLTRVQDSSEEELEDNPDFTVEDLGPRELATEPN